MRLDASLWCSLHILRTLMGDYISFDLRKYQRRTNGMCCQEYHFSSDAAVIRASDKLQLKKQPVCCRFFSDHVFSAILRFNFASEECFYDSVDLHCPSSAIKCYSLAVVIQYFSRNCFPVNVTIKMCWVSSQKNRHADDYAGRKQSLAPFFHFFFFAVKPEKALTLRNVNRKSELGKRQKRRLDHQDERAVEAVMIVGGWQTDGWFMCPGSLRRRCCLAVSFNTLITNPGSPLPPATHLFSLLSSVHDTHIFFCLHQTACQTLCSSAFLLQPTTTPTPPHSPVPNPTPPAVMDATNVHQ